jgi:hypothetical protein
MKNNLSHKTYRVTILSVEDGVEFGRFDSKNVIATDALSAAKKVRLVKTKRKQTFIESIDLLNVIDKL